MVKAVKCLAVTGLCLLALFQATQARSNFELFLVSGYPSSDPDIQVPTRLYRVSPEDRHLSMILELLPGSTEAAFIRAYPDLRRLVVATPHFRPKRIFVVDMNHPCVPTEVNLEYGGAFIPISVFVLDTPSEGLCLALTSISLQTRLLKHLDFSLLTGKQVALDASALTFARIPGAPGVAIDDTSYPLLGLRIDASGFLKLAWWDETGERLIDMGWPRLPHGTRALMKNDARWPVLGQSAPPVMSLATCWIATATLDLISARRENDNGKLVFRVLNKSEGTWHDVKFPGQEVGALTQLKPFGHWLAGVPVGKRIKEFTPELVNRVKTEGRVHDNRFVNLLYANPRPELFLYNTQTDQSFTIDTGDIESEVLLIDNNQVYYRVKDRLYRSTIREGRVEPPELVAQDPALTGVYWAFMGPACQAAGDQGEK
ncbi:MAG: hypothetical protein P8020_18095 [Acidobacteriota bacterium]